MKYKIQRIVYKRLLRPILFKLCPETAHDVVKEIVVMIQRIPYGIRLLRYLYRYDNSMLSQSVNGVHYSNPLLISAGFDKYGALPSVIRELGFSGIELGSFSKEPHIGNPPVRLWRAVKSQSINVWYGLNNSGSAFVQECVAPAWRKVDGVCGVSASATNGVADKDDVIDDLLTTFKRLSPYADYTTINLSCPNLGVSNPFFNMGNLSELLIKVKSIRELMGLNEYPVYCKIGPDHTDEEICEMIDVMHTYGIDGILTCNLTVNRKLVPEDDRTTHVFHKGKLEKRVMPYDRGGMSGHVLRPMTNHIIKVCAQHVKDNGYKFIVIGIGGCDTAEDAYFKIRNGASLIHLITGMIFHGPQISAEINIGLVKLLKRDGYNNISEAIGVDLR
jgi:dihydroorotate dehydrogenase